MIIDLPAIYMQLVHEYNAVICLSKTDYIGLSVNTIRIVADAYNISTECLLNDTDLMQDVFNRDADKIGIRFMIRQAKTYYHLICYEYRAVYSPVVLDKSLLEALFI